ncbi:MAG: glucose-6-phosphate isomerase [Clostridiaceae bacterium]|nr:glucose-6-phosphate isomerase [Clostridiaceae bacterium]
MLTINLSNAKSFVTDEELASYLPKLEDADSKLREGSGKGSDFLGWLNLPENYDREELTRIKAAAKKIQSDSKVLVVIGIGGSYLGARAVIEFLRSPQYNLLPKDTPEIYFAGNNLNADAVNEIITLIGDRDFSVNVISKSGTTTEPAVLFRIFRELLTKRHGEKGAAARIYATTDRERGALKTLAKAKGYESFIIPDDIGGRYSVLTAVGLLPIAAAGIDVDALMAGARGAMETLEAKGLDNPAWAYAACRNALLKKGKHIELLACYDPAFRFMAEWWKQLYGESEGKDGTGIFPASVDLTADLHSMGQYIQDGARCLMETVIHIGRSNTRMAVPNDEQNLDGLNFLSGKDLLEVNEQAFRGTILAHVDGGVPNMVLNLEAKTEKALGELIYFFEYACGLSGYVLGVNPFDQPGVEAYKKNMFALLGKPGYEERAKELAARL